MNVLYLTKTKLNRILYNICIGSRVKIFLSLTRPQSQMCIIYLYFNFKKPPRKSNRIWYYCLRIYFFLLLTYLSICEFLLVVQMNLWIHWRLSTILETSNKRVWSDFFDMWKYVYFESVFNTLYSWVLNKRAVLINRGLEH